MSEHIRTTCEKRIAQLAIGVFALVLFAEPAWANNATPLMWQRIGHVVYGNAIIGIVEGLVIARAFRCGVVRAILLMIPANYFSMLLGIPLWGLGAYQGLANQVYPNAIFMPGTLLLACVIVAFALTVVMEWPFCTLAVSKESQARKWRRGLRASLLAQSVSYALLSLFYLSQTHARLSGVEVLPSPAFMANSPSGWIYFIGHDEGDVWRMRLDAAHRERVLAVGLTDSRDAIFPSRKDPDGPLGLWEYRDDARTSNELLPSLPGRATSFGDRGFTPAWDYVADLRGPSEHDWEITPQEYGGLLARKPDDAHPEAIEIVYDTPFINWVVHNVTALPGNIVIFQFGGQICALDLNNRQLCALAVGRRPVVVLDEPAPPPTPTATP